MSRNASRIPLGVALLALLVSGLGWSVTRAVSISSTQKTLDVSLTNDTTTPCTQSQPFQALDAGGSVTFHSNIGREVKVDISVIKGSQRSLVTEFTVPSDGSGSFAFPDPGTFTYETFNVQPAINCFLTVVPETPTLAPSTPSPSPPGPPQTGSGPLPPPPTFPASWGFGLVGIILIGLLLPGGLFLLWRRRGHMHHP